ncbi:MULTISPECIES: spore germination protein [unclassified Paenibacillus]|uniref:spore germination protein n=1 Tax=unclassified Paenibacillus TaxID=185978 RepID=UPI001E5F5863|nr:MULTISPECIES: spore germination protein [unclassified Paenibacillus]
MKEIEPLHIKLDDTIEQIESTLGNSEDFVNREIRFEIDGMSMRTSILYMDGLADTKSIQNFILETLMSSNKHIEMDSRNVLDVLKERVLTVGDIADVRDFDKLFDSLLSGEVILLFDGFAEGLTIDMKSSEKRPVQEASGEAVIRGPREGFIENIRTNTSLIRKKINDPNLWLETFTIGRITKTKVSIMYINGIADEKVVEEVRARMNRIDVDGILESGYIEEYIQDETYTPFPTMNNTERPDVVAGALLEGRIAILVDGTPFVLLVPSLFIQFFQSAEDYYHRADISSLIRALRFLGFFLAMLGPSLYIAITTFHQEMIPTALLISLASQREGVPFPAFVEALLMEVTFEILRESGVRMPKAMGQAVSIVGTLVIGTAAVDAGIVSAAMVIVVAITAIASFVIPAFNASIAARMIRFLFMALAASFGLFGVLVGLIALILHLCSLRSFGVPFMSPVGPFILEDQKDTLVRLPFWALLTRPRFIHSHNSIRQRLNPPRKPKPRP